MSVMNMCSPDVYLRLQINDFRSFQRNHAKTLDRQWNRVNTVTNGTKKFGRIHE